MDLAKQFLKDHSLATIVAVFVALFMGGPMVMAPVAIGEEYRGVTFILNNDEQTYTARMRDVLDGHPMVSSPNLYEYKEFRGVIPPVYEYPYAIPAFFLGLPATVIASKFVFPAILFFLAYFLFLALVRDSAPQDMRSSKWSAIASALLVILGMDIFSYRAFVPILTGADHTMFALTWTRLVHPIIGALIIFASLLLLTKALATSRWVYAVFAGVLLALSVGYFFSFVIVGGILGALGVLYLVRGEREKVKLLAMMLLIGLVCAIPYWLMAFTSMSGEEGRVFAARNGMFFTHTPILNKFLFAVTLFAMVNFTITFLKRKWLTHVHLWVFITAILLGSWVAYNQQIITGRTVWYPHFSQYTVPLGFFVSMLVLYGVWRERFPRIYAVTTKGIVVFVLLFLSFAASTSWYALGGYRVLQRDAELYAFLNDRAPKDCVVLIREERDLLEQRITANTHCNTYSTDYIFSGVPPERVLHNFLLRLRLAEVTEQDAHEYMISHWEYIRIYFFEDWSHNFGVGADDWVRGRVDMLTEEYKKFLEGDLKQQLLTYRMDYLLSQTPLSKTILSQLPGIEEIGILSGYHTYSFPKK